MITKDPDLSVAPVELRPLLEKCLEKDPRKRLRDISGVELLLDAGRREVELVASAKAEAPTESRPVRFAWVPWAVAAALVVIALLLGFGFYRASQLEERPLVRANLDLPGFAGGLGGLAISRDGSRIAYVTEDADGVQRLATRLLAEDDAEILEGTEDAVPFFSPDGRWIGFGADGQILKVSVLGGPRRNWRMRRHSSVRLGVRMASSSRP